MTAVATVPAVAAGRRPALVLSAVAATDQMFGYGLVILAPEIAGDLGISVGALAVLAVLRAVAFFTGAAVMGAARRRRVASADLVVAGAVARALALGIAATGGIVGLGAGIVLYGLAATVTPLAHMDLLDAAYGPGDSVHGVHRAASRLGNVAVAAAVAPLALSGVTWTTVFAALGVVAAVVALVSPRARPPGLSRTVPVASPTELSWVFDHPRGRTIVLACSLAALFEIPMYVYLFANLASRWGAGVSERAFMAAGLELVGVAVGAATVLGIGMRVSLTPGYAARVLAASTIAGTVAVVATGAVSTFGAYAALLLLALMLFAPAIPLMLASTLSMLPPLRAQFWGAPETVLLVVVAVVGSAAIALVASAFGVQAALVCVAAAPAAAGVVVLRVARAEI